MLFHRIAHCSDKNEVMRLAQEGQIIESAEDIIKRGVTGTVKELLSIINSIHDAI